MLQAILTEPQLANKTTYLNTCLTFLGANGNLKYIKFKINWADTPECASNPFSTQVLAWLGLPEKIRFVTQSNWHKDQQLRNIGGSQEGRTLHSEVLRCTESIASPMSPTIHQ